MKITVISRSDAATSASDWRTGLVIEVDGKRELSAFDGEPEDNNLHRNFSDIHHVPKLMQLAYDAGKRGEELEITHVESDEL